jgi:hypothetical protein
MSPKAMPPLVGLPTLSHARMPNVTLTQPILGAKPSWPGEFWVSQQEATVGASHRWYDGYEGWKADLMTRAEKVVSLVSDA